MSDQGSPKDRESEIAVMKLRDPGNVNGQLNSDTKKSMEHSFTNHENKDMTNVNGHGTSGVVFSNKLNDLDIKENQSFPHNSNSEDILTRNGFSIHKGNHDKANIIDSNSGDFENESTENKMTKALNACEVDSDKNSCEVVEQDKAVCLYDTSASQKMEDCEAIQQYDAEKDAGARTVDKENDSDVIIIDTSDTYDKSQNSGMDDACKRQSKCQSNGSKATEPFGNSSSADASITSFARLLHDLGVELVRQHVYKDLIEIQLSKDSQNKLNEREKEQLMKLEEFYNKQEIRNAPYSLKSCVTRCKCRVFATDSLNVMQLHQEYGRIEGGTNHVCCCCREFRTRWPSHFIAHMKSDHGMLGRLRKKMSPYKCSFCSYEAKNQLKIDTHMVTCSKRFVLACNLQPLPADADIPLKRKFIQQGSYASSQQRYSNYLSSVVSNYAPNFHLNSQNSYYTQSSALTSRTNDSLQTTMSRGNNLYSSVQQSISGSIGNNFSQQMIKDGRGGVKHPATVELCEICGVSMGNRAVLLNHLQIQHKVKLNTARGSTEPTMSCDRCPSRFWTYQGLAKHATVVHRINAGSSSSVSATSLLHGTASRTPPVCHICGESQTLNPLNHMSTRHNVTLLDMFYAKQCYICNKSLKNGPAFQDHMVLYHRDIFANKDVLHTVLQALSAARHLKREESLQHHNQATSQNFSRYKKTNITQPVHMVQSNASNARTPVNRKRTSQQAVNTAITPTKVPEKKSQEQDRAELEKLYENLAGIGRPILRSMRQKMSSGNLPSVSTPGSKMTLHVSASPSADSNNSAADVISRASVGTAKYLNDSGEPAPKKAKIDETAVVKNASS